MGDVTRLSQVLQNLLHNAAKYTPDGGKIVLSGSREGDQAVMRVRDSGVGIAPELLTRIFDIFTQGHRTLDRSDGGLGIGLTLVRRLVILHGGSVEAYSEGLGKGSEFVVRLPSLEVGASADSREEAPTSAAIDAVRRVLVVDDNVDSLESMALLVRHFGHDVRVAHNGSQAVSTAAETIPEVILLDIGLPGMDGYEVARRIRAIPGLQPCRIIAMTGYGQETDRVRSRLAGFDDHLVKPVEPETLRKILRSEPLSG
jgi:two-component system CheB/CheR fusion protein